MVPYIKDNGKMINHMVMGYINFQTGLFLKDNLWMVLNLVKGNILLAINRYMLVVFLMGIFMEMES
jgi:hypothetical protein